MNDLYVNNKRVAVLTTPPSMEDACACDVTTFDVRYLGVPTNKQKQKKLHMHCIIVFTFVKMVNFCSLFCCGNYADRKDWLSYHRLQMAQQSKDFDLEA